LIGMIENTSWSHGSLIDNASGSAAGWYFVFEAVSSAHNADMLTSDTIDIAAEQAPPKQHERPHPASRAKARTAKATPPAPAKPAQERHDEHPGRGDLLLYALLALLIAAAWQVTRLKLFKPNDDLSYWIAVAGGSMMLALFSYPLRKYVRFMQGLGKVKWWFWVHLFLGIGGPWLILVHSGFHVGSLNAGVALYSMAIVVASGVVGRFIYVRINRGLNGERVSLVELRERAGMVESDARSKLDFSPEVKARLLAFEQHELRASPGWLTHLRQVTLLPLQQAIAYLRCAAELRRRLRQMSTEQAWTPDDLHRRERRALRLADRYLDAVVRVAQYSAYERLFALWHLAHLPFVYLLIISAVVHVIAVHAY
jgi:hypothetical protein